MATALNVSAWSTTAASNDGADSTIGTVANTSAPNVVDDWVRGIMASVKRYILDTDGGITAGGTANALTITTNRSISSGHQAAGFSVRFKAANTNTGAATVAVDGLSAVSIKRLNGDALSAGDIVAGGIYDIAYDGTNYILMGGASSGVVMASTIELGGGTDTTLSRSAPGVLAVEGRNVGYVLLASGLASGATLSIPLTGMPAVKAYRIIINNLRPATDGVQLWIRTSTDGGANYSAGSSDYAYGAYGASDPTSTGEASAAASFIAVNPGSVSIGNGADEAICADMIVYAPNSALQCKIQGSVIYKNTSGVLQSGVFRGVRLASADVDAIRFLFSSGNITSGDYAVYGML
jgi:hypothetical protein